MLSNKAKYALKAMHALAACTSDETLPSTDIAHAQNIPKKFLDLILFELRRAKLLTSARGQTGGYRLAKPAAKITLADIVRAIDGPLAPIACASVTAYERCADCDVERDCPVNRAMRAVRNAASDVLDSTTLEMSCKATRRKPAKRRTKALA